MAYFYSCFTRVSSVITKKCAYILDMEGQPKAFSASDASKMVSSVIEPMAMDGLRTIGIAYKDFVIGKGFFFFLSRSTDECTRTVFVVRINLHE